MTIIRHITRAVTRPVLSWLDAVAFAFFNLVAWQYHWAWWLQLLAFAGFGLLVGAEHDWLRWRASRKEPASEPDVTFPVDPTPSGGLDTWDWDKGGGS